jgi:hypothetical protein
MMPKEESTITSEIDTTPRVTGVTAASLGDFVVVQQVRVTGICWPWSLLFQRNAMIHDRIKFSNCILAVYLFYSLRAGVVLFAL